ncbi:unnamed protein product, partial [marine sediment metagenome]
MTIRIVLPEGDGGVVTGAGTTVYSGGTEMCLLR